MNIEDAVSKLQQRMDGGPASPDALAVRKILAAYQQAAIELPVDQWESDWTQALEWVVITLAESCSGND